MLCEDIVVCPRWARSVELFVYFSDQFCVQELNLESLNLGLLYNMEYVFNRLFGNPLIWRTKLNANIIENVPRHEKTNFRICENKGADQLRSNYEADQRLCIHYTDSKTKSEISNF